MADDIYSEEEKKKFSKLMKGEGSGGSGKSLTILIIAAVVLAAIVFAYFYLIPSQYQQTALTALLAGAVIGGFLWLISIAGGKKLSVVALAARIFLISVIAFGVLAVIPFISPSATNLFAQVKSIGGGIGGGNLSTNCALPSNYEKCFGAEAWKTTKSDQYLGGTLISVNWQNAVIEKSTKAFIPVSVKTEIPLNLKPKCFNEKGDISVQPSSLTFGKDEYTVKTVTCTGELTGKVGLRLETTSNLSLTVPVWIGKGSSKGVLSGKTTGPYNLEISSFESQPFDSSKDIFIKMIKKSDFNLTKINSFEVQTIGTNIEMSCPEMTGTAADLSGNFKSDTYTFACKLEVINLPSNPEQSVIELKVDYSLAAEYRTNLNTTSV